jgi:hypothetical protein
VGVLLLFNGCGSAPKEPTGVAQAAPNPAASEPAKLDVPSDAQAAATSALGAGVEIVAYGDLASNGHDQAFAVNRLAQSPGGDSSAIQFTRAAILQRDGARWVELLRCDEYLKNPAGFLTASADAPVDGWQVVISRPPRGIELTFSPLAAPASAFPEAILVRWNAAVKRYQSLDESREHFVSEVASLEPPRSPLR